MYEYTRNDKKSKFIDINGVKMGSCLAPFMYRDKGKAPDDVSISVSCPTSSTYSNIHINKGEAVNVYVNGQFVYGPIVGDANIEIK